MEAIWRYCFTLIIWLKMQVKTKKYPKHWFLKVRRRFKESLSIQYKMQAEADKRVFESMGKVGDKIIHPGLLDAIKHGPTN